MAPGGDDETTHLHAGGGIDKDKTAFRTPWGELFEWLVAPFGLNILPAVWHRIVCNALRPILGDFDFSWVERPPRGISSLSRVPASSHRPQLHPRLEDAVCADVGLATTRRRVFLLFCPESPEGRTFLRQWMTTPFGGNRHISMRHVLCLPATVEWVYFPPHDRLGGRLLVSADEPAPCLMARHVAQYTPEHLISRADVHTLSLRDMALLQGFNTFPFEMLSGKTFPPNGPPEPSLGPCRHRWLAQ